MVNNVKEAMETMYDLHSPFNIEKHKETYVNYLEVIIHPDGTIEYAVPSHQEKLIAIGCKNHKMSRAEYEALCPQEYYFDFMTWLVKETGCISVWNDSIMADKITTKQKFALRNLKLNGLYKGSVRG